MECKTDIFTISPDNIWDTHTMADSSPEKQPRRTFSDLMAYRPQKNGTSNTGLKYALIITAILIIIAFCAAVAILFPYLKLLVS